MVLGSGLLLTGLTMLFGAVGLEKPPSAQLNELWEHKDTTERNTGDRGSYEVSQGHKDNQGHSCDILD